VPLKANPHAGGPLSPVLRAVLFDLGLFLGMLLLLEVGRRIAQKRGGAPPGAGAVDGAVFALLGLLIAFTFSGAASRFDTRRQLVVQEANAIGTAYLRLDLLPQSAQPVLRESFRRYVDSRLAVYRKLPDVPAAKAELERSTSLQNEIWSQAVAGCRADAPPSAAMLLLPALNEMIDITTVRTVAAQTHTPAIVFAILTALALASSLLAGHNMAGSGTRSWLHMLAFAATMAMTLYVILDLEFPRLGLIRLNTFDNVLVELRKSMK
jgi:hypothetical protein